MRRTEFRACGRHAACQDNLSRRDGVWQVKDLLLKLFAVVVNLVVHAQVITNMLLHGETAVRRGDL